MNEYVNLLITMLHKKDEYLVSFAFKVKRSKIILNHLIDDYMHDENKSRLMSLISIKDPEIAALGPIVEVSEIYEIVIL